MEKFIIVDTPTTYNAFFERSLLNTFRAIISTYHMVIKFSAETHEITIWGDLQQSCNYYLSGVSNAIQTDPLPINMPSEILQLDTKRADNLQITETIRQVSIQSVVERTFHVSSNFHEEHHSALVQTLLDNLGVFVWTVVEMSRVDVEIACHQLNV